MTDLDGRFGRSFHKITRPRVLSLLKRICKMRIWCVKHNDPVLLKSLTADFRFWKDVLKTL